MRVGTTNATVNSDDQHDVDGILELQMRRSRLPSIVIKELYDALSDAASNKEIKNRCVRLQWKDMHIDITPAVLAPEWPPRSSEIYDCEALVAKEMWPIANPEGFANWFLTQVGSDYYLAVTRYFNQSTLVDFPLRPVGVSATQLCKRYRDIHYDGIDRDTGPMGPPSVLITYFGGLSANDQLGVLDQLAVLASSMRLKLVEAEARGQLIRQRNPVCDADDLTDRWPRNHIDQTKWIGALDKLANELSIFRNADLQLKLRILERLFGTSVANRSFSKYVQETKTAAVGGSVGATASGTLALTSSSVAPRVAVARHYGPR
jgi:hypothetical protein